MTIAKKPAVWTTGDGREFTDREKAERYEALRIATLEFNEARRRLEQEAAQAARTMDGQPFDFTLFKTYWTLSGTWRMPQLREVRFGYGVEVIQLNGRIILRMRDSLGEMEDFPVSSLYVSKENALAAVQSARRTWLEEQRLEIERREAEEHGT